MAQTVFERVGGFSTVSKVVMDFYDRILDSEKVGDFFEGIDMPALVEHQTKFISSILGGPASYSDAHIQASHQRLNIDQDSFDELIRILKDTLKDHSFSDADISATIGAIESRRNLIVSE